ncbi:MAG: hypothetical protein R3E31_16310 [Chloroflexota bacterium]
MPAYTAASTTMIPKGQYGRASGMRSMAEATADRGAHVVPGCWSHWLTLMA